MVLVVQDVHEISIKRMNVIQFWETLDNTGKSLTDSLLHEFYLTHVKLANSLDFEALTDLGRRLALSLGQHNIDEILGLGDLDDLLEVIGTCQC